MYNLAGIIIPQSRDAPQNHSDSSNDAQNEPMGYGGQDNDDDDSSDSDSRSQSQSRSQSHQYNGGSQSVEDMHMLRQGFSWVGVPGRDAFI